MGICSSSLDRDYNCNLVKLDGKYFDVTKDYLLEESIKEPLNKKYKITKMNIGNGAFGKVLLGLDSFGNKYAIKLIKKIKVLNGQLLLNEVRIGKRINHPNILKIKEVYEDKKYILFIMDYIDGGSLFNYIVSSPNGKLDILTTLEIMIQILEALDYLHNQAKICHRDIKPENFLVTMDKDNKPFVKLIDFGLAHEIKKGEKMKGRIGTTVYMAPEILKKLKYNEKVDMWSAGVLLFNMVTGCEPFSSDNEEDKILQILNCKIEFDAIDNEDIKSLCKDLMEKNPSKRIDSKSALIKAKKIKKKLFGYF